MSIPASKYEQLPRIRAGLAVGVIVLLLAGFCLWGFFGRINTVYQGVCYDAKQNAYLLIPINYDDLVKEGDDVWVGNARGSIYFIDKDSYVTYESIKSFIDDREDQIAPYFDKNMVYYLGFAEFTEELQAACTYKVVTGSVSPFEAFFLRGGHG